MDRSARSRGIAGKARPKATLYCPDLYVFLAAGATRADNRGAHLPVPCRTSVLDKLSGENQKTRFHGPCRPRPPGWCCPGMLEERTSLTPSEFAAHCARMSRKFRFLARANHTPGPSRRFDTRFFALFFCDELGLEPSAAGAPTADELQ